MSEPRTPIALITGSLGSGKTTLLRRILEGAGQRLAVLMNEFGEIAIDSRILPGDNLRIVELAGGCVCCELTGEFEAAVGEIVDRFAPELIVVEATGVAEADALAYEVQDNLPQLRLDAVIHIVDAVAGTEHPEVGYAARSQLRQADIILINKTDLVNAAALDPVESQVRRYNDRAFLHRCVRCDIDPRLLFGFRVPHPQFERPPHDSTDYQTFSFTAHKSLDRARFEQLITSLPANIYRAKGFVCFGAEAFLFNYVAGRADLEPFPAEKTELVFIGPHLSGVRGVILERLREAEV